MRYCLKFILPLIQLVFVQCNDDHRNHFYEKLFQSSNSTSVTTNISQLASSQGYNKLVHFQTRTERPTTFVSTFTRSKRYTINYKYTVNYKYDRVDKQMCTNGSRNWHCPPGYQCGTYDDDCCYFGIAFSCWDCCCCCCEGNLPRTNAIIINPVVMEPSPHRHPRHLEPRRPRIENFNLQSRQIENLRMTTSLRNTINSTARQLSGIDCSSNQVATTYSAEQTSRQPPSYDDLVRLNLITDPMEPQSLLPPPTYDDFMRRNNQREV